MAEYGLVVGQQVNTLRRALPGLLEDAENGFSFDFRSLLEELRQDLIQLDKRRVEIDKRIRAFANADRVSRRLRSMWLNNLWVRRHKNVTVVALANKKARIVWALLRNETDYLPAGITI